nr:hypothetical protein [Methylomonas lenta]
MDLKLGFALLYPAYGLMALVGQIMKETQGKANPGEVNKMLIAKLKG